jgi:hypothetical protein
LQMHFRCLPGIDFHFPDNGVSFAMARLTFIAVVPVPPAERCVVCKQAMWEG